MGAGGSAMAAEAADAVVMSDNFAKIPEVLAICRLGRILIVENCVFTIAVKVMGVILAILGLSVTCYHH